MAQEITEGAVLKVRKRLSLSTAQNARKALCHILRQYALATPEARESAEYVRVLIHGLSELLADYRKEKELEIADRVSALESQLTTIRERANVARSA